ncbi:MAG TPA: DeoR/GlpR family DNA-binding transcription regulator [Chloroflexota bacterium]|nr:DeoR/GlpR family DNA-binding transcription regulator [Chloroflexota bacterium]
MDTEARRERIVVELIRLGFMRVPDIAERFSCSLATARRDVQALAVTGRVIRSHGGAMPRYDALPVGGGAGATDPFLGEKQRIAQAAALLVHDGETVGLSGGTTTHELARCLRGRPVGVVTNAVDLALELAASDGPRVMLVGGVLDYAHGHELLGALTEQMLANLNMDLLFVSVNGISVQAGVTIIGELNAQIMRVMASRSRRILVVADHTKIGRTALSRLIPLAAIDTFVTDAHGPDEELEAIRTSGVRVVEA